MQYSAIVPARFLSRPNRFIARVELEGQVLNVHVKNTGRCAELLRPGCTVYLQPGGNPARKTPYDLIAEYGFRCSQPGGGGMAGRGRHRPTGRAARRV